MYVDLMLGDPCKIAAMELLGWLGWFGGVVRAPGPSEGGNEEEGGSWTGMMGG